MVTEHLKNFLGLELLPLWDDGQKLLASASGGFSDLGPQAQPRTAIGQMSDYSFVVFPFAKVYEGFLKKLFLQIGAITGEQYNNDRWRVGRALNPELEKEFRHVESVYDRIVAHAGVGLADELWRVWKRGRNQIFHFWPGRTKPLTLAEAKEIVGEIEMVMEKSLVLCKI